jgi:hypothetical protein
MGSTGLVHLTCPRCKGGIDKTADECKQPHTFVHQSCGTALQYDPADPNLPLIVLPGQ